MVAKDDVFVDVVDAVAKAYVVVDVVDAVVKAVEAKAYVVVDVVVVDGEPSTVVVVVGEGPYAQ